MDHMLEDIESAIDSIVDTAPFNIRVDEFEQALADLGYMIVPIEDPTNLRFGVDD